MNYLRTLQKIARILISERVYFDPSFTYYFIFSKDSLKSQFIDLLHKKLGGIRDNVFIYTLDTSESNKKLTGLQKTNLSLNLQSKIPDSVISLIEENEFIFGQKGKEFFFINLPKDYNTDYIFLSTSEIYSKHYSDKQLTFKDLNTFIKWYYGLSKEIKLVYLSEKKSSSFLFKIKTEDHEFLINLTNSLIGELFNEVLYIKEFPISSLSFSQILYLFKYYGGSINSKYSFLDQLIKIILAYYLKETDFEKEITDIFKEEVRERKKLKSHSKKK